MKTLINILTIFFILLVSYQIILAYIGKNELLEGLQNNNNTYKPYDTNNPANALILAQQNAGNINFLKEQLDELSGLNKEVEDISGNVHILQGQVRQLVSTQQQYANKMTGGKPPHVTGLSN
jgi:hypothetical protein